MIILGDYASTHYVDFSKLKEVFSEETCVVNLEGAVTKPNEKAPSHKSIVFNTTESISALQKINIKIATMANNHIFDLGNQINYCKDFLSKNNISTVGA